MAINYLQVNIKNIYIVYIILQLAIFFVVVAVVKKK